MHKFTPEQKKALRNCITDSYDFDEMKRLCADLGIDWEDVYKQGTNKFSFAYDLVAYCCHRNLLDNLVNQIGHDREHINPYNILYPPDQYEEIHNEVSYYDHDTYSDSTDDNDEDSGCLSTIVIRAFIAFVIIGVLYLVYSNHQKQAMLREPDEFIGDYFRLLGTGQHSSAWERLSGDYRINKYITGYVPYSEYWRSYKRIEILSLEILNETPTQASVSVFLTLTKLDDTVVNESITFQLERTGSNEVWIITDSSP